MHGYKRRRIGNDMKKLLELHGHEVKFGEYTEHIIQHDPWCKHFKGKPCNCDPDVIFNPTQDQLAETVKSPDHSWQIWGLPKPPTVH